MHFFLSNNIFPKKKFFYFIYMYIFIICMYNISMQKLLWFCHNFFGNNKTKNVNNGIELDDVGYDMGLHSYHNGGNV
jgi:hypothetical protein